MDDNGQIDSTYYHISYLDERSGRVKQIEAKGTQSDWEKILEKGADRIVYYSCKLDLLGELPDGSILFSPQCDTDGQDHTHLLNILHVVDGKRVSAHSAYLNNSLYYYNYLPFLMGKVSFFLERRKGKIYLHRALLTFEDFNAKEGWCQDRGS
jgi:hypothetical protein